MTLPAAGPEISHFVAEALKDRHRATHRTERAAIDVDSRTVSFAADGQLEYTLLLAVPQAVPPQVIAHSPLAGEEAGSSPTARRFSPASRGSTRPEIARPPPTEGRNLRRSRGPRRRTQHRGRDRRRSGDRFDGTGYCFLEFPGQRASTLEGHFFAQPPEVRLAEPDTETFARKQAFETERLRDWLDVGIG